MPPADRGVRWRAPARPRYLPAMLTRPLHLGRRQVRGRAFSVPLRIIPTTGTYELGEWVEEEGVPVDTKCAEAPPSPRDARVRVLTEGGVRLDAIHQFWTAEELEPVVEGESSGDILVWAGQRWRVQSSARWGSFSDSLAVRQEAQ